MYRSTIQAAEEKKIELLLDHIYKSMGDKLYFTLKSEGEVARMIKRSISVLKNHSYMSPNQHAISESFEGIREKLSINGRFRESDLLNELWNSDILVERRTNTSVSSSDNHLSSDSSVSHNMLKLLLTLGVSPSQSGKYTDVIHFPPIDEINRTDSTDSNSIAIDEEDKQREENDRKYIQEWGLDFDCPSDDDFDSNDSEDDNLTTTTSCKEAKSIDKKISVDPDNHKYLDDTSMSPFPLKTTNHKYGSSDLSVYMIGNMYNNVNSNDSDCAKDELFNGQYNISDSVWSSGTINSYASGNLICSENDICKMVIELLQGYENDIFTKRHDKTEFILSLSGLRVCCAHISVGALRSILLWFLEIGNMLRTIRAYSNRDISDSNMDTRTPGVKYGRSLKADTKPPVDVSTANEEEVEVGGCCLDVNYDKYAYNTKGNITDYKLDNEEKPNIFMSTENNLMSAIVNGLKHVFDKLLHTVDSELLTIDQSLTNNIIVQNRELDDARSEDKLKSNVNYSHKEQSVTVLELYRRLLPFENAIRFGVSVLDEFADNSRDMTDTTSILNTRKSHIKLLNSLHNISLDLNNIQRATLFNSHAIMNHPTVNKDSKLWTMNLSRNKYNDIYIDTAKDMYLGLLSSYYDVLLHWVWSGGKQHSSSSTTPNGGRKDNMQTNSFFGITVNDCTERAIPSPYSEMISLGIRSSQDLSVINRYGHSKGSRVETSASYETSSRHSRHFLSSIKKLANSLRQCMSPPMINDTFSTSHKTKDDLIDKEISTCYIQNTAVDDDATLHIKAQLAELMNFGSTVLSSNSVTNKERTTSHWRFKKNKEEKSEDKKSLNYKEIYCLSSLLHLTSTTTFEHPDVKDNDKNSQSVNSQIVSQSKYKWDSSYYYETFPNAVIMTYLNIGYPLINMMISLQHQAIKILFDTFHLKNHFSFICELFYLKSSDIIVLPFQNVLTRLSTKDNADIIRDIQYDLSKSITSNASKFLPRGYNESLFSIRFVSFDDSTDSKTRRLSSERVSEKLFYLVDSFQIEMHYPAPLSEIFTNAHMSKYNSQMRFLLKLYICEYDVSALWKKITDADSVLSHICGNNSSKMQDLSVSRQVEGKDGDTQLSHKSFSKLHNKCVVGFMWLINTIKALKSYYMYVVHDVHMYAFFDRIQYCNTIEILRDLHWTMLDKIDMTLSTQQISIFKFLELGISALVAFDEAYQVAESSFSTDPHFLQLFFKKSASTDVINSGIENGKYAPQNVIHSRLQNASRSFAVMRDQLKVIIAELNGGVDQNSRSNAMVAHDIRTKGGLWVDRAAVLLSLLGDVARI